jgi:hypothetical protein
MGALRIPPQHPRWGTTAWGMGPNTAVETPGKTRMQRSPGRLQTTLKPGREKIAARNGKKGRSREGWSEAWSTRLSGYPENARSPPSAMGL